MKHIFLSIFVCCVLIGTAYASVDVGRGMFVSVLDANPILADKQKIQQLIEFSKKAGIKTLFVQVYRANKAWFPSSVADSSPYTHALQMVGEDAFALLIRKAHENGIAVHAWVNLLSLSKNQDAYILKKFGPSILTKNKDPKGGLDDYKIDNQFFLEPSDPRVKRVLLTVVTEILRRYRELDGIQFDYIRYPDVHPFYGYSPYNMQHYKKATGVTAILEDDPRWKQWKRDNVTHLLQALVRKARSIKRDIHLSTTGCVSYVRAHDEALQDWPRWLNDHVVEFVTMMSYPIEIADFEKNIIDFKKHVNDFKDVNIAVGAYKLVDHPDIFMKQFDVCQQAKARSCVVFHYSSVLESPSMGEYLTKGNYVN